jgi:hypothetical protein
MLVLIIQAQQAQNWILALNFEENSRKCLMYWAVRVCSGLAWRSNQRKRQEGYSKVAGSMPTKAGQLPREL